MMKTVIATTFALSLAGAGLALAQPSTQPQPRDTQRMEHTAEDLAAFTDARIAAMKAGSAARYGHDKNDATRKISAEGIEALKEVSGSVDDVLGNLIGGVQSGMGYLGARTLSDLREKARYIRISPAGQKEAAPHDVIEVSTRKN